MVYGTDFVNMAKAADRVKSNILDDCSVEIIEKVEMPPTKKLKQARLPFHAIDHKIQKNISPQAPKKRKLSDQESPSAKTPKIINKSLTDKSKHDKHNTDKIVNKILDKGKHDLVSSDKQDKITVDENNDNEVSSSSEAENQPLLIASRRRASGSNLLERFVKKFPQEEISSTNEVVDLTDSDEQAVVVSSTKEMPNLKNDLSSLDQSAETDNKTNSMPNLKNDLSSLDQSAETDNKTNSMPNLKNDLLPLDPSAKTDNKTNSMSNLKNDLSSLNQSAKTDNKTKSMTAAVELDSTINALNSSEPDKKTEMVVSTGGLCVDGSDLHLSSREDTSLSIAENAESVNTKSDVLVCDQLCEKDVNPCKDVTQQISSDTPVEKISEKTETVDEVCQHSNKDTEDVDQSDVECLDGSLLDTSTCIAAKSDESFSDSPLSTSTTSSSKSPKLVTSTPTSRPRSLKMSEVKKQEKEAARQERRQKYLEKMKKKEEEKLLKEKLRQEEKEKKEKERLEKKAQLEQERLEKLQQKEEEKKKKQELLDAKFEEKKKKEEEKRLKDEERQKEEEEKMKKKHKAQQAFSSFFIKQKTVASKPKEVISSFFMPFEVKTDMILAPVQRRKLCEDEHSRLDECLKLQNSERLYVSEVTQKDYKPGTDSRTISLKETNITDIEIIETDSDVKKVTYPAKFLAFHTNYRPPYFGTWRKRSKVLTPRNPFKKDDDLFDYEVDSDDEWEEEEPGESLENSEGEEEKEGDEEEEEEEDGWMVPHGYLSEDEICEEDEEVTPEVLKARQMAKAEAWEAEMKRQCQPVLPLVIGCFWEGETPVENASKKLETFKAVCIRSVIPIPLTNDDIAICKDSEGGTPNRSGLKKPVPEEAIPYLIQLVHGNTLGIKKLVKEFRLFWKQKNDPKQDNNVSDETPMEIDGQDSPNKTATFDESLTEDKNNAETDLNETKESSDVFSISKRQLEMRISAIAIREKRQDKRICWFVHENILEQYGCQGISLPSNWQYVSNVKKQPKASDENSGRKTPKDLPGTPSEMICDENLECGQIPEKSLSKDQRSIMDFARKNTPVVFKEMEKPASSPSLCSDTLTTPIKTLPNDQRSITDFTKKCQDNSPQQIPAPTPFATPKPVYNTILNMIKTTPKVSRKSLMSHLNGTSPKAIPLPVRVTDKVPEGVLKPTVCCEALRPVVLQNITPVVAQKGESSKSAVEVDDNDCILIE